MNCTSCGATNPESNRFCGRCGARLAVDSTTGLDSGGKSSLLDEQLTNDALKRIAGGAKDIEIKTYERIQERVIKWAKVQLTFVGVALAVVAGVFAWFGYKTYDDFQANVQAKSTKVTEIADQAKAEGEAALKSAKSTFNKAQELEEKINKINPKEIDSKLKKLDRLTAQYEKAFKDTQDLTVKVRADREELDKLKRSLFTIFIHFSGTRKQRDGDLIVLLKKLRELGFLIGPENIAQMSVDRSEVIYYHNSAREQAELIADVLERPYENVRHRFAELESRSIERPKGHAREILVKLTMK